MRNRIIEWAPLKPLEFWSISAGLSLMFRIKTPNPEDEAPHERLAPHSFTLKSFSLLADPQGTDTVTGPEVADSGTIT